MQCIWPFGHESRSVVRCPSACLDLSHDSRLRSYARAQQFTGNGNYPLAERISWTTQTACAMVWRYDSTCDQAKAEERNRKKLECLKSLLFEVRCECGGCGLWPSSHPSRLLPTAFWGVWHGHLTMIDAQPHSHTIFFSSGTCRRLKRWSATFRPNLPLMGILSWYWLHVLHVLGQALRFIPQRGPYAATGSKCVRDMTPSDPKPQWLSDLDVSWSMVIHGDPWPTWLWHGQHGSEGNKRVSHTTQPQARVRIVDIPQSFWTWFCVAFSLRLLQGYPDSPSSLLQTEGTYVSNCASVSSAVGCLWDVDWSVSAMHSARMKHTLRHLLHGDRESFWLTLFSLSYQRFHVSYIYIHRWMDG